jgi:hypothetical protein
MSKEQWKVNDGTQVAWGGGLLAAGETFSATEDEITADGLGSYVTKVRHQAQPKAANKAVAAPKAGQPDRKDSEES